MNVRQEELHWQERAIGKARAGDQESAWIVVRAMMIELDVRYPEFSLLKRFSDFIEALLNVKDAVGHGAVAGDQLGALLKVLGITRSRGQRKVKETSWDDLSGALVVLQTDESPVLRHAATFIESLLLIKKTAEDAAPSRDELVGAFDSLCILSDPWRPPTPYRELLGRLAAEKLERLKGKSVAQARASLEVGPYRLSASRQADIHTDNQDLVKLIDRLSRKELDGLVGNLVPKK